jgi:pyruvate formate lyase activating enzyme
MTKKKHYYNMENKKSSFDITYNFRINERQISAMDIKGLQKLTLLDFPGKMAATIFTGGCNFRCPFCHNALLVTEAQSVDDIEEKEVLDFLKKREKLLDGICVTGGEPFLQPDLDKFLEKVKETGLLVKIDTNGSMPDRLEALINKGLVDYVAMDIKNSRDKYAETTGMPDIDMNSIEESVKLLMHGTTPYEFRTTVVREFHEDEDMEKIGKWLQGDEKYFLQKFVDSGALIEEGLHAHTDETMMRFLEIVRRYVPNAEKRGF